MQQKTQRPVQFEVTEQTRESIAAWIRSSGRRPEDYLFPNRSREPFGFSDSGQSAST
jgi:hypothetical protein